MIGVDFAVVVDVIKDSVVDVSDPGYMQSSI